MDRQPTGGGAISPLLAHAAPALTQTPKPQPPTPRPLNSGRPQRMRPHNYPREKRGQWTLSHTDGTRGCSEAS